MELRAALIGCGDVSTIHLEAFDAIDYIKLVAVCDTDPNRLAAAVERTGAKGYSSVEELLSDKQNFDVVHVTTPHFDHADTVVACLEAGVNVIMEKPLAHTIADGQRIIDAADNSNAKIGVCLQNRYNVSSQQMRRVLDEGLLGDITGGFAQVVWTRSLAYYERRLWRGTWQGSGGGVLINQALHTLDLLQWFLGPVTKLRGRAQTLKFADVIEVEDTASAFLTHESGVQSSFYATLTPPIDHPVEIEIIGTKGRAVIRDGLTIYGEDGSLTTYPERKAPSSGRAYWGVSHEVFIRDFYESLDAPEPFWIGPREAMESLRIIKEIYAQSPEMAAHN
ncbi:Gfo/Idh/MocA family protein [Propionimicrobium sp. BV2F7]|uniref:Gfo/Idh/MocA family protein n=1 Tax=Propionimicrobium sp. BV2F7 TaxID=1111131 RepID=UPI0003D79CD9|nr:Gfo/Idh/MocA family oxidoreductase [Propionimicrobium sp. BV2F7]ETJ97093.1 oxidoreductase, NAD-binding domain protein [Propionimicrobium sp. BV2F7]